MNLASASFVPTITLFKANAPTLYWTLGDKDLSIEISPIALKDDGDCF